MDLMANDVKGKKKERGKIIGFPVMVYVIEVVRERLRKAWEFTADCGDLTKRFR